MRASSGNETIWRAFFHVTHAFTSRRSLGCVEPAPVGGAAIIASTGCDAAGRAGIVTLVAATITARASVRHRLRRTLDDARVPGAFLARFMRCIPLTLRGFAPYGPTVRRRYRQGPLAA